MNNKGILVVLLLAVMILVSGCTERYVDYCLKDEVIGAYNCKDGLLKVDYFLAGKGFELIKSDGTVISCPVVAPDAMSEECKNVLEEGYCESTNLCTGETLPEGADIREAETTTTGPTTTAAIETTTTIAEVTTTTVPVQAKGEFELMISDAKADIDDFDALVVDISKTRIFSGDNDSEAGFTEFDVNASVDLTQVVGEKAISVLQIELDVGSYTKIELYVSGINGTVNGSEADVKVPSDKLKVIKPFEIKAGETTMFVFDINVVKKGQGLEYNLLPVIGKSGIVGMDVDVNETECTMADDCGENETCVDGSCVALECVNDDDCNATAICLDNECVEVECKTDEGCSDYNCTISFPTQLCRDNACDCIAECVNATDCEYLDNFTCVDNECVNATV